MDKYKGIYKVDSQLINNSKDGYHSYEQTNKELSRYKNDDLTPREYEKSRARVANYEGYSEEVARYKNDDLTPREYEKSRARVANYEGYGEEVSEYNEPLYRIREGRYCDGEIMVYVPEKKRERKGFSGMLVRLLISAVIFLSVFGMSKSDMPFFVKVVEVIKQAITYDYDSKTDKELGEVRAVTLIKEGQEKEDKEQE